MEAFLSLASGLAVAIQPMNLLFALIGVLLGTAVGVLPGIGPALTVALLLPITFKVGATGAFILFCGVYYGAMYGGSTAAVGSFIAGTVGTLGVSFLGPVVVELALQLGPAEYFSLMLLCFVTVSAV